MGDYEPVASSLEREPVLAGKTSGFSVRLRADRLLSQQCTGGIERWRVVLGCGLIVLALGFVIALVGADGDDYLTDGAAATAAAEVGGSCAGGPSAWEVPRELGGTIPLIFDSDFGSFMDDSFALAFALGSPEISVQLAIAVGGQGDNPVRRARVLGRHLNEAGRGHIRLASGPPNGGPSIGALEGWGSRYVLAEHPGGFTDDAAAAAAEVVRQHAAEGRQVVWAVLGAHTAAADFARRFPELWRYVRVVAMGVSVCSGYELPWGPQTPWPVTNEKQDVPAANAVIQTPWGGGPVLFAPVATSSAVVLSGPDYADVLDASRDANTSPGLSTLVGSYVSWWEAGMAQWDGVGPSEAATVDPKSVSVEIFDALAIYLAFSQQGLTTHTITMAFQNDGLAAVTPADAALLPCNTSSVPELGDGAGVGALVAVAIKWQPGQLQAFNHQMKSRLIAGGRPCPRQ